MHIQWVWDTDRAPDSTHVVDFFVLGIVVWAVLFFTSSFVLVLLRINTASVRSRRFWSLLLMTVGSVTHIVAEFITNAHIGHYTWFDQARTFHCTFWDYWFKYGLGFNLWQVAQAGRLFAWFVTLELKTAAVMNSASNYSIKLITNKNQDESGDIRNNSGEDSQVITQLITVQNTQEEQEQQDALVQKEDGDSGTGIKAQGVHPLDSFGIASGVSNSRKCIQCNTCSYYWYSLKHAIYKRRFGLLTFFMCIMFGLPGILLCLSVEFTHSIKYSDVYRWCVTDSNYVYITVAWLVVCVATLVILLWRMRKYNARDSTSYKATFDSTVIGIIFLVILVIANRFEVSVFWWGRAIQTLLVVTLYVFSFLRLTWGMFRDARLYGLRNENPHTRDATLSDIEFVLSGDQYGPTFEGVMRTKDTKSLFISIVQNLPIWSLPSSFMSNMDRSLLTPHYAARCVELRAADGHLYVEPKGARRNKSYNASLSAINRSSVFAIEDSDEESIAPEEHPSETQDSAVYQFSNPNVTDSLMVADQEDFKHVPLKNIQENLDVLQIVQNAHAATTSVCPVDVWDLYCMYSTFRMQATRGMMKEAAVQLRAILQSHFPIREPNVHRKITDDQENKPKEEKEDDSQTTQGSIYSRVIKGSNGSDTSSTGASLSMNNIAGAVAAATVGAIFYPPSVSSLPSSSISSSSTTSTNASQSGSARTALYLDRFMQPTTRVFAQFFVNNRPPITITADKRHTNSPLTSVISSANNDLEDFTPNGIHTLPLSKEHLREAYLAAAQCSEDMDMNDPLDSVNWMCHFLFNDVWLPYCARNVDNFLHCYKLERRNMALSVAIADGLTNRPMPVGVTVV